MIKKMNFSYIISSAFLFFYNIKTYADIYIPDEEIIEEKIQKEGYTASNDVLLSLVIVGIVVVLLITLAIIFLRGKGKKVYGR